MKTLVLDIEADNLLRRATKAWIIGWLHKETGDIKYWLDGDLGWKEELDKADVVVAHNGCGYDLLLLEKLFNYKLPSNVEVHDTMIMSLVLNYNRFPNGGHSLKAWGEYLGDHKGEFDDFSEYSEEMLTYWKQDVKLTNKVHKMLMAEYRAIVNRPVRDGEPSNKLRNYLRAENAVSRWFAQCELYGWPFNVEAGTALLVQMEAELQAVRDRLLPKLGSKTVPKDKSLGVVTPKKPKWLKNGAYDSHTCKWFGVDEWSGACDDRLVEGEYSRVEFLPLDVNSITDVKVFLFRHGWKPTEWNYKNVPDPNRVNRTIKFKTSPKITEDSLECMEGDGKLYCDFLTTSSRVGILKGWLKNVDENGRLHGTGFTIGTPSMRARHSIIVNVPSADAPWGKQMRSLFSTEPGWVMIGADSSGNQARGLAHYLRSPEYVDLLLNGDIHQYNADKLTEVLKSMGIEHKVPRKDAKRVLYAFLFGANGQKLWSYIFGAMDEDKGKKLKIGFTKAVPGFKILLDKLDSIYAKSKLSGDGYIPGIAGNKIFCNSFHKLLVYLLQACEKATCSSALMLTVAGLEAEGIPYFPLAFVHDELQFTVPAEYADRAAEISKQSFKKGPLLFGITIMDGESKKGLNWYDTH